MCVDRNQAVYDKERQPNLKSLEQKEVGSRELTFSKAEAIDLDLQSVNKYLVWGCRIHLRIL